MYSRSTFRSGTIWRIRICTVTELGVRGTYAVHLQLIGKLVGDFLLVIIELFSLGAFVLPQYTRLTDGQNLHSNAVRMLRSRTVKTVTDTTMGSVEVE